MNKVILFFISIVVFLSEISSSNAQNRDYFRKKYLQATAKPGNQSFHRKVFEIAKKGNSVNFQYLSYQINSKNLMFKASSNEKYLEENFLIISNILKVGLATGSNIPIWHARSDHQKYEEVANSEVILYEGYLLRYIAEYCYLVNQYDVPLASKKHLMIDIRLLENVFMKWHRYSLAKRGDDSYFYSIRTHMGSHWATTAMYLFHLTKNVESKKLYVETFTKFDRSLRANMKKRQTNGLPYFVWNSSWDVPFTSQQKERKLEGKDKDVVQDVTHGNHVVQYILDSYTLGLNDWTRQDIFRLANTIKLKIWNPSTKQFSDLVDGKKSMDRSLSGTGWKQSDGWMKLMQYDPELKSIYLTFYFANKEKIDKSYLNGQFYSVFYAYL